MRYGENALDVIERVKKKVEELKPTFPDGVELQIAYDRSALIGRSIDTLKHALIEEMIVVVVGPFVAVVDVSMPRTWLMR